MSKELEENNMDPLLPSIVKTMPAGFWKTFYKDLGQPTLQVLGKTLAKAVDFCSLPINALTYANDAFKMNMEHRLKQYAEKIKNVPDENLHPVDPQIGAPVLDCLSYTTNDEIADLFTTLLANASNAETLDKAHPSFVHIISHLSVDEAKIIRYLQSKEYVVYCSFRAVVKEEDFESSFITPVDHATLLSFRLNLDFPKNVKAYISNLESLGVLKDIVELYKTDDIEYNEICEKYDLDSCKGKYKEPKYKRVDVEKGFYEVTPFGRLFIDACIKD